ncbi:MAG: hypothetical protein J6U42_06405 [Lachnospiraceae bacterium]|nr:hypothetical protein [Lachnospiraceae bacterium]
MGEKNQKDHMPILPFNDEENNHYLIYDNCEYTANRDRIANRVEMSSENMIKYYSAKISDEPVSINPEQNVIARKPDNEGFPELPDGLDDTESDEESGYEEYNEYTEDTDQ